MKTRSLVRVASCFPLSLSLSLSGFVSFRLRSDREKGRSFERKEAINDAITLSQDCSLSLPPVSAARVFTGLYQALECVKKGEGTVWFCEEENERLSVR